MNSHLTEDFVACFRKLPTRVQQQARRAYQLWRNDSGHRSLHFKRIHTSENIWSVRIGKNWRALGYVEGNEIYWYWIGSHAEYDTILASF